MTDEMTERVRDELRRIERVVVDITGLPSNWSGEVELVSHPEFKGKKPFSCHIVIDEALADQDVRWRTLIHEILHAVSVGYNQADYNLMRGWEEAVVEQLQRLIRPKVLRILGVGVPDAVFTQDEASHLFNRRLRTLDGLRQALGVTDEQAERFYVNLLTTPIKSRQGVVLDLGRRLPESDRREFLRLFSEANAVLRSPA